MNGFYKIFGHNIAGSTVYLSSLSDRIRKEDLEESLKWTHKLVNSKHIHICIYLFKLFALFNALLLLEHGLGITSEIIGRAWLDKICGIL